MDLFLRNDRKSAIEWNPWPGASSSPHENLNIFGNMCSMPSWSQRKFPGNYASVSGFKFQAQSQRIPCWPVPRALGTWASFRYVFGSGTNKCRSFIFNCLSLSWLSGDVSLAKRTYVVYATGSINVDFRSMASYIAQLNLRGRQGEA